MDIVNRRDALNLGKTRFFTGKPCMRGHMSERYVTTGNCITCNVERSRQFSKSSARSASANQQGLFTYLLDAADFAAATAYCQGLDLARGRTPSNGPAAPPQPITAEGIKDLRLKVYGADTPPPMQSSKIHPDMEAQLRRFGLLK